VRILHISTRLILGGSQENTILSCEGQSRLGHDVHLAFGPIFGPEGSLLARAQAFRTADQRTITTHTVPNLIRELNPFADYRAYHELKALIESLRPDIVHTHSSKAGILGRAAAWNAAPRPAIIHTIHGPPFMPVEGSPLRRLKTLALNHAYTLAERHAARRCHAIVSVADAMTAQFLARRIGRAEQFITVRSGMEVADFLPPVDPALAQQQRSAARAALGFTPADLVIGTVARLAEHKGHDDLLESLATDLRSNPTWKLLWVGDGWWRKRLITRARTLGLAVRELDRDPRPNHLPAQIILTGLVPQSRVPAAIHAMDILAHPSAREGLPRTVPQALLAGVVPVAYDVDGTREACIDRRTGRLIPPGNRQALRAAIVDLAGDPAQRARLASAGQALCRELFSTERMVAELDQLYRKVSDAA
jgi:glycosyltransferase involved in cell wall biosynthesis